MKKSKKAKNTALDLQSSGMSSQPEHSDEEKTSQFGSSNTPPNLKVD